jgi:DNA-binding transcriptional LysR family regulator
VELRQLRVFVAVAEELSFSRAASRLDVVQSAVSATVRKLEREWGVPLFHRTTHSVRLTGEGRALLGEARTVLAAAEAIADTLDAVRGGLRGTLRLGIMQAAQRSGSGSGSLSVAEIVVAFRAVHPEVVFEVRQAPSADQAAAVRGGDLDLAFVALPDRRLPGLDLAVLVDQPIAFVCHRDHPLAGVPDVTLKALAAEPFAELPPGWGVRIANDRAFASAGVDRAVAYEINDVATVTDFVRHGLATALLPPAMVAPAPELAFVPIRRGGPRFVVSLAAPADRTPSAAARAFVAGARRIAGGASPGLIA